MEKDWIVWLGCLGLFLAGGVYFQMLPELTWKKEVGLSDLVGVVSAVAAAVAAIAARRSALISKEIAADSRAFSRMQAYVMHRQQFEVLLGEIEKELKVRFWKKDGLYNDIFPTNRSLDKPFSMKADGVEFLSWVNTFKELMDNTNKHPPMRFRDLTSWMVDQLRLTGNYLRFTFEGEGERFYIGGMDTRVSIDEPMRNLMLSSSVLNHLFVFGMVDDYLGISTPPHWFYEALEELKVRIEVHSDGCEYK